jgi:hypothetical protein
MLLIDYKEKGDGRIKGERRDGHGGGENKMCVTSTYSTFFNLICNIELHLVNLSIILKHFP